MLSILFPKTKVTVGLVQFDAALSETHRKSNEVTAHPVEAGVDVVDHIRPLPEEIEISGVVSDTPLVYLPSLRAPSPITDDLTHPSDRADIAYWELNRIMDEGELIDVITKLREYENMAITSFTVDRDAATGNVLNASLSLRQVVTVESQTVAAPEPVDKGNTKSKSLGKKTAATASSANAAAATGSGSALNALVGVF